VPDNVFIFIKTQSSDNICFMWFGWFFFYWWAFSTFMQLLGLNHYISTLFKGMIHMISI